jgi:hypothetical protein
MASKPPAKPSDSKEKLRSWLETGALYVPHTVQTQGDPPFPDSISQPCEHCTDEATTTWRRKTYEAAAPGSHVRYDCAHCERSRLHVWFTREELADPDEPAEPGPREFIYTKIGQSPAPSVTVSPALRKALKREPLELYRRGLICLNQGYGIAALAYLRRVVEDTVGDLLDLLGTLRNDDDFSKKLAEAKKSGSAQERLRLIAELVPPELRIGGSNPFKVLYDNYSDSLHAASDEECAHTAAGLRKVFEHVHATIATHVRASREFEAEMKTWRDRGKRA